MGYALGLDFGTTNTAAFARYDDGRVAQLSFDLNGEDTDHCRSALFFLEADVASRPPVIHPGNAALEACLRSLGEGRFMQSLKSFLASRTVGATQVYSRKYSLEDLLAFFLSDLHARVEAAFGGPPTSVVVGVPVCFAYAKDDDDDQLARSRLLAALHNGGFGEVTFALEPVAAAWAYAQRATGAKAVLVADFGGGTSDFAVVKIDGTHAEVLATSGVAVAGDDLDAKLVQKLVAPALGRGTTYVDFAGVRKEIPPGLFNKLERWHHLSFMNNAKTLRTLQQFERDADEPEKISTFIAIIEENLGFHLHDAVRQTKQELSSASVAAFSFTPFPGTTLEAEVARQDFEDWIAPEIEAIGGALDTALDRAGLATEDINAVFMTGGTSFVPTVRQLLSSRFGDDKLSGGEELVSIAAGLSAIAAAG